MYEVERTKCVPSPKDITIDISRTVDRYKKCLICRKENNLKVFQCTWYSYWPWLLKINRYYNIIVQFDVILHSIETRFRDSRNTSPRVTSAIFLTKLRTGLFYHILSTLFTVSKDVIRICTHNVGQTLIVEFLPKHLGLNYISYDDFVESFTRSSAKTLFTQRQDKATGVADETYVLIEKSFNYRFQRRTYYIHKGWPLVKPMMLVSITGCILEVLGPYFIDNENNDAPILTEHIKSTAKSLWSWLHEDDVIIIKRGFRDCVCSLLDLNLIVKMPNFWQK